MEHTYLFSFHLFYFDVLDATVSVSIDCSRRRWNKDAEAFSSRQKFSSVAE
jgi:hypothetical protein